MAHRGITFGQTINLEKLEFAKKLRKTMTPAEKVFWRYVRNRKYPHAHFRRQQIIDGFIVDFYCSKLKVVVEIDGAVHRGRESYDAERDRILERHDIIVLRVSNSEVLQNIENVMKRIFFESTNRSAG